MGKPATYRLSSGLFRFSGFQLLVSLGVLLVALPFLDQTPRGALFEGFLMTLVLLAAVVAVGGRRKTFVTALALVIPVVITKWLDHLWPGTVPIELVTAMAMVFLAYIALQLLRFVLTTPRVDGEVLCSAAATYLVLGMLWAYGYALVAHAVPDAFAFTRTDPHTKMTRFEALYFSYCTLTTVGYGDIAPISKIARTLAMAEATTGMFFVTILIARLVALYSTNSASSDIATEDR